MRDDIDAVKASATQIIDGVFASGGSPRLALVAYRDYGSSYITMGYPFTQDKEAIRRPSPHLEILTTSPFLSFNLGIPFEIEICSIFTILRLDLGSGTSAELIATPESEYSATIMPGGSAVAVIRVELDSTQRLWAFPLAGGAPRVLLERIKPVGYQAWLDSTTVGVFVLGSPATLQVADLRTGTAKILLSDVGRAVQRVPGRRAISVTHRVSEKDWWIVEVDAAACCRPRDDLFDIPHRWKVGKAAWLDGGDD